MADADDVLAAAEPVRHGAAPADAAPPPYPPSFGPDFAPPPHYDKPLHARFADARDARIRFYELPHVYTIDGRAYDCSVTSLIKGHCEEFDARLCIQRMKASKKTAWPRLEYAVGAREVAEAEAVAATTCTLTPPLVVVTDAVTGTTLHSACVPLTEGVLRALRTGARTLAFHVAERACTDAEIVQKWEVNKVDAANRGTWVHWQLELWSNSLPCHVDAEVRLGLRFVADVLKPMGVRCYATEKEIFGECEEVCGSVDWIGYYEDDPDAVVVVDWKRSKNLATSLVSAFRKRMRAPLGHLEDCDGCKYALQLGCYAYMLEKYYGKRVRALALCCVHPNAPTTTFVPYLRAEVAYLMRKRREVVAARVHASFAFDKVCALTGHALYDPVQRDDGALCNRKDALVAGVNVRECPEEARRVNAEAERATYALSAEEAALACCRPWRKLMPETGLMHPP